MESVQKRVAKAGRPTKKMNLSFKIDKELGEFFDWWCINERTTKTAAMVHYILTLKRQDDAERIGKTQEER
jgi:hypothetical protein